MRKHGARGQSLVESALVIAVLGGLLLGIAEIGQALFARQTLSARVHDAARWAAIREFDPGAIRNFVIYGAPSPRQPAAQLLGLKNDEVQVDRVGCPQECRVEVGVSAYGVRAVEPVE
jgi:TadE-like protein